jgi:hypothetical protein
MIKGASSISRTAFLTTGTGRQPEQTSDQPRVVAESVEEFLISFAEALAIVLVVSFVSLGWRTGIVVALSVPMVLAIVFLVMFSAGMNFDRRSSIVLHLDGKNSNRASSVHNPLAIRVNS